MDTADGYLADVDMAVEEPPLPVAAEPMHTHDAAEADDTLVLDEQDKEQEQGEGQEQRQEQEQGQGRAPEVEHEQERELGVEAEGDEETTTPQNGETAKPKRKRRRKRLSREEAYAKYYERGVRAREELGLKKREEERSLGEVEGVEGYELDLGEIEGVDEDGMLIWGGKVSEEPGGA